MLADLDLLLIAVFCAADDLLPSKPANATRIMTDGEVVTLYVTQSMMAIYRPNSRRSARVRATTRLRRGSV
jgi:hypothetical protein